MCGCLLRLKKIIPGGSAYTGPFASSFQTAFVRIRAWRLCDFPPANFTSDGVYDISSKGAYFIQYFYQYVMLEELCVKFPPFQGKALISLFFFL